MHREASKIIDLTHTLTPDIPCWDGDCGFHIKIDVDYPDCSGPDYFRTQTVTTRAGMGTHIDAPAHCIRGGMTTDSFHLENLITECVVIKVSDVANEKYLVTPDVIKKFESSNGEIRHGAFVIFHFGWDRFWGNPEKYRNNLHFPGVHEETAMLLLERRISGLGTDTLSADSGGKDFPCHRAILGADKYLVENIANAEKLPETGSRIFVLPMKIKDATEAPVRLIALT